MLVSLAISDVVLIDRLSLNFDSGLCALTGETGAGKSILLDSLGLALGMRGSAGLVRQAAKDGRASVTAAFEIDDYADISKILEEADLTGPADGEALVLRRTVDSEGRSRAYINDQPVSISMLRRVGDRLVEIQGQFATQGLLDSTTHRVTLDGFAGAAELSRDVSNSHQAWREALDLFEEANSAQAKARADEKFLRFAVEELAALDPQPGEEEQLAETRTMLMNGEKLVEALNAAEAALTGEDPVEARIGAAIRVLDRQSGASAGRFELLVEALGRAAAQLDEAQSALHTAMADAEPDPARLEECEERLFSLRAAARKHGVTVEELPALRRQMEEQLASIDDASGQLDALRKRCDAARQAFHALAEKLSDARRKAAGKLDKAVHKELPPLRLEKAQFITVVEPLEEADWGPHGIDRVRFDVITNPGAAPGPLAKIASGGELARFLLALKVVLQDAGGVPTLVFDEVDSGVGGATAAAVGKRLAQLAADTQVLVVTHSPQVAAHAVAHMRVEKSGEGETVTTSVAPLSDEERREEIARMLAGATVTEEARAAADSLIRGHDA